MHAKKLSMLVEKALESGLQERTFVGIQGTILESNELQIDERMEVVDGESLYRVLERLQAAGRQISLYSRELAENLRLGVIGVKSREIIGEALRHFDFYGKAKQANGEVRYLTESCYRGPIFVIKVGDRQFVLKRLQRKGEAAIAPIAAETPVAPMVEEIKDGWLVEEFIEGPDFYHKGLETEEAGKVLGKVYGHLHSKKICYNDGFTPHLLFPERGPVMIDYGVSYLMYLMQSYVRSFSDDIETVLQYSTRPIFKLAFWRSYHRTLEMAGTK